MVHYDHYLWSQTIIVIIIHYLLSLTFHILRNFLVQFVWELYSSNNDCHWINDGWCRPCHSIGIGRNSICSIASLLSEVFQFKSKWIHLRPHIVCVLVTMSYSTVLSQILISIYEESEWERERERELSFLFNWSIVVVVVEWQSTALSTSTSTHSNYFMAKRASLSLFDAIWDERFKEESKYTHTNKVLEKKMQIRLCHWICRLFRNSSKHFVRQI